MSKRLILVLALLFVVGTSCAAYAEVQNVKVSGDILVNTVSRQMFGLHKADGTPGNESAGRNDSESMLTSQVRLRVDADLTDNVAATVRLINERNWNRENTTNTDIDLDLAYVTLKEFLYSPLSLTVGRQEIRFGNGLVVGNARSYNHTTTSSVLGGIPSDLSLRRAFDAIRATLNYDPLVIDAIYAKIDERITPSTSTTLRQNSNQDTDLWGVNAS